jgi:molybdopterin-containing oxidoreductase family iron-sulfur binding subunit
MTRRAPYEHAPAASSTPQYWRSLEERSRLGDSDFLASRAAEFPMGVGEVQGEGAGRLGRRGFMGWLGAAFALAGAEGCRRPVEKILPYGKQPTTATIGVPQHFATVSVRRGEALGVVALSHEGRPTKLEGNPDHPASLGASDLQTQAEILGLYDPDRAGGVTLAGAKSSWDEFFKAAAAVKGDLHVLAAPTASPAVAKLRERFAGRLFVWSAESVGQVQAGAKIAFGQLVQPVYAYENAKAIVSLDADFLQTEAGSVAATKGFAKARRLRAATDTMARLWVAEPSLSLTGANADERLPVKPSEIHAIALGLAKELKAGGLDLGTIGAAAEKAKLSEAAQAFVKGAARDLLAQKGAGAIVAGSFHAPEIHALVAALNEALGNTGKTVRYYAPVTAQEGATAGIEALVAAITAGKVKALLVAGSNPVYDTPADVKFGEALAKVAFTAYFGPHADETAAKCQWHLAASHALESWGDAASFDGTYSVQQPLIAPLRDTKSELEVLAALTEDSRSGMAIVRETFTARVGSGSEKAWRKALHDGLAASSQATAINAPVQRDGVAAALEKLPAAEASETEVHFVLDAKMGDGRFANNPWLKELPDPITKITWDNAAIIGPKTAADRGIKSGDLLKITVGSATVEIAAWVLPGVAEGVFTLPLGWGRTRGGRMITPLREGLDPLRYAEVEVDGGFDVYPLRSTKSLAFAAAKVESTGGKYVIAVTQEHHGMDSRPIARETVLADYKKRPNFAEQMGPQPKAANKLPLWQEHDYSGPVHKWGMSIDLAACTGCNACVVACQAENNIGVVGKRLVKNNRELHWLRIDRYFLDTPENEAKTAGDPTKPDPMPANPRVAFHPVACQQCEEAPCENVCPVNATAHGPEGLNDMAYNRCIGTRYCANNCPYKVRRFNYMDYKSEFWGDPEKNIPRHDLAARPVDFPATVQMQFNPDVTVRMRGVMEKCTYCVQRIQRSKIAKKASLSAAAHVQGKETLKAEEILLTDTEVPTPACAQTCPADAIVFGNLNDPNSRVSKLQNLDRKYALLGDLGTQPRTKYLGKVRNPSTEG